MLTCTNEESLKALMKGYLFSLDIIWVCSRGSTLNWNLKITNIARTLHLIIVIEYYLGMFYELTLNLNLKETMMMDIDIDPLKKSTKEDKTDIN